MAAYVRRDHGYLNALEADGGFDIRAGCLWHSSAAYHAPLPPLSDAGRVSRGPVRFSKTFPALFLALAG